MTVLLPGPMGSNLGFFQGAAPATAASVATIIGQALPVGTVGALVQAVGADVAFRLDGQAPTSTVGFTLFAGAAPIWVSGAQLRAMQLIQGSGGAATLNFGFYGQ